MRLESCRRLSLLLLAALLPLGAAVAGDNDYAYRFALNTHGESGAWRIELTPAVYGVSRPDADLGDLVVVNARGQQVPFAPLPVPPPAVRQFKLDTHLLPLPGRADDAANQVRVQRNAGGDIVIAPAPASTGAAAKPTQWLFDAGRQVRLSNIEFAPSAFAQDLHIRVAVDASNDLQQWDRRSEDVELVGVKRGEDAVEQRSIEVSGDAARYYRIVLTDGDAPWDATQTPAIDLVGSYTDPQADRLASLQWQELRAAAGTAAKGGGTDYDYQLPAPLPIEAARVNLADQNTAARFTLQDRDEGASDAGGLPLTTITAVQVAGKNAEAAVGRFDAVRVQHLRLHTDTPLPQPPRLALGWHADSFVFLAQGAAPYSLLAGSYAARRALYPIDAALAQLRPGDADESWQPPQAEIGARSEAGGPAVLLPPKVPYDWTRPLLWLVLIGGALLVAGMALSLLKQSRRDNAGS